MKQLVILAGGMGTRLKARLGDLPKPMIPIGGKPLLEHQVELAKRHGFEEVLIFACYRADLIERHFGNGQKWGLHLRTIVEKEPLGTAGAVLAGFDLLADEFAVIYGDTMLNVDLERMRRERALRQADAVLLLHPNNHPLDSDLVEAGPDNWITRAGSFRKKKEDGSGEEKNGYRMNKSLFYKPVFHNRSSFVESKLPDKSNSAHVPGMCGCSRNWHGLATAVGIQPS
jgi:NDP-sugar pyrophosphorylase family protein